ncbi:ASCH domain-containing protein [Vibrio lamellibrachiae]
MNKESRVFLQHFLNSLPKTTSTQYHPFSSDYFCADEYNANLCADLILRGEKRASCSMEYWYSNEGEVRPEVGHLQVVTNWDGKPICVIEITSVSTSKYNDVTAEFAIAEGEGDKTLEWWKKAHWAFFVKECKELKIEPSEEMLLLLEHFKVVYPIDS